MTNNFYTLGFLFNADHTRVVLSLKQDDTWQKGLLNGVGGEATDQEPLALAQARIFHEKTGLVVFDWTHIATIQETFNKPENPNSPSKQNQVFIFAAAIDEDFSIVSQLEDEFISDAYVAEMLEDLRIVADLKYFIPHAIEVLETNGAEDDMPF